MDVAATFFKVASNAPASVAITHNGQETSYAEFAAQVADVADVLTGKAGSVVAVPAARSPHTVAAFLATQAARRTYCPVDPTFPTHRQAAMVAAARCDVALRTPAGAISATIPDELYVAGSSAEASVAPPGSTALDPEAISYILFTSGSTGEAKPVEVPNRAIGAVTEALRELYTVTPGDRVLQFSSLSWDTSLEEILPTLTVGATLVIHDKAYLVPFGTMLRTLSQEHVTVMNLPTAFWHELVSYLAEERPALPESLRMVIVGGEPIDPGRLAAWRRASTEHIRLLNAYGCTETSMVTHAVDLHGPCASAAVRAARHPPIGRALPHVRQHLRRAASSADRSGLSELLVGGPSVALGYRGDPDLTADRFVHVDIDGDSVRCFRTGDLVQEGVEGMLVVQGRADRQLKVRGVRLDPGEAEGELLAHPEVASAAVVGVQIAGRTTLIAYVVPRHPDRSAGLADRLRSALPARLPDYLVPARILVVDKLLYTVTGKINQAGMIEHYGVAASPTPGVRGPRS